MDGLLTRRYNMRDYLTELPDKCNHPEINCTTSDADAWGMFTIYCSKCDTLFSRYDYQEIEKQRKRYKDVRKE
jgi:hypothetical protein